MDLLGTFLFLFFQSFDMHLEESRKEKKQQKNKK